jgi:hypothetical protein
LQRVTYLGATVLAGSPADFGRLVADETEKWTKAVKFASLKPDNPTSTTPFGESDLAQVAYGSKADVLRPLCLIDISQHFARSGDRPRP